ncbi:MAG: hypothetical protein WCK82_03200 [Bacteroidota bacterium]
MGSNHFIPSHVSCLSNPYVLQDITQICFENVGARRELNSQVPFGTPVSQTGLANQYPILTPCILGGRWGFEPTTF